MSCYTPPLALTATLHLASLLIKNNHSFCYADGVGRGTSSFIVSLDDKATFELIITLTGEYYLDDTQFADAESLVGFLKTAFANFTS